MEDEEVELLEDIEGKDLGDRDLGEGREDRAGLEFVGSQQEVEAVGVGSGFVGSQQEIEAYCCGP